MKSTVSVLIRGLWEQGLDIASKGLSRSGAEFTFSVWFIAWGLIFSLCIEIHVTVRGGLSGFYDNWNLDVNPISSMSFVSR